MERSRWRRTWRSRVGMLVAGISRGGAAIDRGALAQLARKAGWEGAIGEDLEDEHEVDVLERTNRGAPEVRAGQEVMGDREAGAQVAAQDGAAESDQRSSPSRRAAL